MLKLQNIQGLQPHFTSTSSVVTSLGYAIMSEDFRYDNEIKWHNKMNFS